MGPSVADTPISLELNLATAHILSEDEERYIQLTTITRIRNSEREVLRARIDDPASLVVPVVATATSAPVEDTVDGPPMQGPRLVLPGEAMNLAGTYSGNVPLSATVHVMDTRATVTEPDAAIGIKVDRDPLTRIPSMATWDGLGKMEVSEPVEMDTYIEDTQSIGVALYVNAEHAEPIETEIVHAHPTAGPSTPAAEVASFSVSPTLPQSTQQERSREVYILIPPFFRSSPLTESDRVLRPRGVNGGDRVNYKESRLSTRRRRK